MPTIGVAIALPEPWATRLQDYRTSIGDHTAAQIPTHITLVPPTELSAEEIEGGDVERHLGEVAARHRQFCIHLRGTGTFRPVSPVVFVSLAEGIAQCEQLAAAARSGPLASTLTFPYHPHVTVAHHLADDRLDRAFEELSDVDCTFDVREFHLYGHDETVGWKPEQSFALQPLPAVT